jgi:hypothetical protein
MGMTSPGAEENYKFVLNVSHWLSGLLDPDAGTIDTNITSGPSGSVNSTSATFEFSSTQEGSTFVCTSMTPSLASVPRPKNTPASPMAPILPSACAPSILQAMPTPVSACP